MLKKVAKVIAPVVLAGSCFQNVNAQAYIVMKTDDDVRGSVSKITELRSEVLTHGITLTVGEVGDRGEIFLTWATLGAEINSALQTKIYKSVKSAMTDSDQDLYLTVEEPAEEINVRRATGLLFTKLEAFEDGEKREGYDVSYDDAKKAAEESANENKSAE